MRIRRRELRKIHFADKMTGSILGFLSPQFAAGRKAVPQPLREERSALTGFLLVQFVRDFLALPSVDIVT